MPYWHLIFELCSLLCEWKITAKFSLDFCGGSIMLSILREQLEAFSFTIFLYTVLSTLRFDLFHWNRFSSRCGFESEHLRLIFDVLFAKTKASDEKHTLGRSLKWMQKEVDQKLNSVALQNHFLLLWHESIEAYVLEVTREIAFETIDTLSR